MAQTTPNMSLKTWDLLTDTFSHTDLRTNFVAIDVHDHTAGKGVQIPVGGIANNAVSAGQIVDGSVTNAKLAGSVDDTKLLSPNNGIYRLLGNAHGVFTSTQTQATYVLLGNGSVIGSGSNTTQSVIAVGLNSADFGVGSKTTKLRLRATCSTNTVAPTSTFTVGLYPVSSTAGASGNIQYTLGSVVAGSTVAFVAPGATTQAASAGVDFSFPSNGVYVFGIVVSSSNPVLNSVTSVSAALQIRHV